MRGWVHGDIGHPFSVVEGDGEIGNFSAVVALISGAALASFRNRHI